MTVLAFKVILHTKQVCTISKCSVLTCFFVTLLTLDNKEQIKHLFNLLTVPCCTMLSCDDFGSKELSTNAAIISIGYTVLCFDVLACDEHRYLAAIDYS